jgi:hypothetical protein
MTAHACVGRADPFAVAGVRFSVPLDAQDTSYLAASVRISSLRFTSMFKNPFDSKR